MSDLLREQVSAELDALRAANTYKTFLTLRSPQGPVVEMEGRGEVIVLSSNNYLGLAAHPAVIEATGSGARPLRSGHGVGAVHLRHVRAHRELEAELAELVGTEAALTYVSCWNANEAVIPSLTDESTVLLSDELNHASIIDAMRLAKPARKVVFQHSDMDDASRGAPRRRRRASAKLVVTDGVFSMEGDVARLPEIVELAREHDAIVVVDDSHGTGVMGATGRGVAEHFGVLGEIDVITSTLGKALGGAAGGFVASSREVCDLLAQRSRPQLFSNAIPPTVACGALAAVRVLALRAGASSTGCSANTARSANGSRRRLPAARRRGGDHPDHRGRDLVRDRLSRRLLDEGVFVTGFGFPVVPEGKARVRVQMSAALEPEHLDRALAAFETGRNGQPACSSPRPARPGRTRRPRALGLADRPSGGGREIGGLDLRLELLAALEADAQVVDSPRGRARARSGCSATRRTSSTARAPRMRSRTGCMRLRPDGRRRHHGQEKARARTRTRIVRRPRGGSVSCRPGGERARLGLRRGRRTVTGHDRTCPSVADPLPDHDADEGEGEAGGSERDRRLAASGR